MGIDMIAERTEEKLLFSYAKQIKRAASVSELKNIDWEITRDDNVSVKGYAVLTMMIQLREETL